MEISYTIKRRNCPLISAALHDGHFIPPHVLDEVLLKEHERFREEDPYTSFFANLPTNQVIVHTSRFMVDMNRSPDKAIYKVPEDAWGLHIWKNIFPDQLEKELMAYYFRFYQDMTALITDTIQSFGHFLILDIHSYNHRRESPQKASPILENPEINLGTAYNLPKWRPIIDRFISYLSAGKIGGKPIDVRENIKFKGGGFSQWVTKTYGEKGCVLSIEFKKTFMDEWTGRGDIPHIRKINDLLKKAIPSLLNEMAHSKNVKS